MQMILFRCVIFVVVCLHGTLQCKSFSHDCYVKQYYFKEEVVIIIFITIIHVFMFLSHFWWSSVSGASFSQNQAISFLVISLQLIKSSFTAEKF